MSNNRTERPRQCTCGNAGKCGYCPQVAVKATRQGQLGGGTASSRAGLQAAARIETKARRS